MSRAGSAAPSSRSAWEASSIGAAAAAAADVVAPTAGHAARPASSGRSARSRGSAAAAGGAGAAKATNAISSADLISPPSRSAQSELISTAGAENHSEQQQQQQLPAPALLRPLFNNAGLSVNVDPSAAAAAVENAAKPDGGEGSVPTPLVQSLGTADSGAGTAPSTAAAAAALPTPGSSAGAISLRKPVSSGPLIIMPKKANQPNRSKMMALVGEMLPSNALDPTGYENHEAEARKRQEEIEEARDAEEQLKEGELELDDFGNRRYTSVRVKIRMMLRKHWRKMWKIRDPASPARQYWSLVVVAALLYGMVEIPLRIGFEQDVVPWSAPDVFNLFVDIFFLIDVIVNFRTGYFQEDSRLVLDEKKIAIRYIKGWFVLDLFTSIPFSHIAQAATTGSSKNNGNSSLAALTLPRLLRIIRIARLFKILRMLKLMVWTTDTWMREHSGKNKRNNTHTCVCF